MPPAKKKSKPKTISKGNNISPAPSDDSSMSFLGPIVQNPAVQNITMSVIGELLSALRTRGNGTNQRKEIENLRQQVAELTQEREVTFNSELENNKQQLAEMEKIKDALAQKVCLLQKDLYKESSEAKDKEMMLSKIRVLENEMKEMKVAEDKNIQEAEEIKKECEEEKRKNQELTNLTKKLVQLMAKLNEDIPSTTATPSVQEVNVKEKEIIDKLSALLEQISPEKSILKKKKISKAGAVDTRLASSSGCSPLIQPANVLPTSDGAPPFFHINNPSQSSMMYANVPSQPNMMQPPNMPTMPNQENMMYPNMPGKSPEASHYPYGGGMPHGMIGHDIRGSSNFHGPYPPNNAYHPSMGQPIYPRPSMPYSSPSAMEPPPHYSHNTHPYQPNIFDKPNNLANYQKQNKNFNLDFVEPTVNKPKQKEPGKKPQPKEPEKKNQQKDVGSKPQQKKPVNMPHQEKPGSEAAQREPESKACASGKQKNTSKPPLDLWEQLDNLKSNIKDIKSPKSQLMSQVPTLMMEAHKSTTVTSKDKFIEELSDCMKQINDLPESSSINQNRRNFKTDFKKKGYNYRGPAANNGPEENNEKEDDDDDDDDGASVSSETHDNGKPKYFRFGHQHYKRYHYANRYSSSNQNEDESYNSDDASSVCSERTYYTRGRGRGRGNYRGRGNFRGWRGKNSKFQTNPSHRFNQTTQDNPAHHSMQNIARPEFSYPPPLLKSPSGPSLNAVGKKPENKKKDTVEKKPVNKTIKGNDDDDDQANLPQGNPGFAGKKTLKHFIGNNIPSLMEAIEKKIDVTLKVKNCLLVATSGDRVVQERPESILDIIQFKLLHSNAVCVQENLAASSS